MQSKSYVPKYTKYVFDQVRQQEQEFIKMTKAS